jgi:para-nitrobenzyl esterase
VLARLGPARERVMAAYGGDAVSVAQDLTTETTVIEPDRHLARLHTKNGQKAWTYYFSYVPEAQRASVHGTAHGGEILYAFGNLRGEPTTIGGRTLPAATPADRKISDAMHAYWIAFAKTSDPDSAGGPKWPVFDSAEPALEFGADGVNVRPQFRKATLDIAETIANLQAGRR